VVAHRLLHEDDGSEWRRWLAQARVAYHPGDQDISFNDFGMILQAARDGQGVALVDDVISSRDLDEGRLVQPLSLNVPASKNYHCICTEENLSNPAIGSLVDWLVEQSQPEAMRAQSAAPGIL
jgi:LysR family glycine cleavage system transcriptional activator